MGKPAFLLSSELIRAARALLRWEQRDLSDASSVSLPTVKRLRIKTRRDGRAPIDGDRTSESTRSGRRRVHRRERRRTGSAAA